MKAVGGWEGCCQSPDFKLHGRIGEKLQLLSEIDSTTAQFDKLRRRSARKKKMLKPVGFFCLNKSPCYETVVLFISSSAVWQIHYSSADSVGDYLAFQPLINKHNDKFLQKTPLDFSVDTSKNSFYVFYLDIQRGYGNRKVLLCG